MTASEAKQAARTCGAHHVGLTVPDLGSAAEFFLDALGFEQVGGNPGYPAVFVSDGTIMITLWQASSTAPTVPFDRSSNIGLHHLALRVSSGEALRQLGEELERRSDVSIEFRPEPLGDSTILHMMCRIPGDIRLELIAA